MRTYCLYSILLGEVKNKNRNSEMYIFSGMDSKYNWASKPPVFSYKWIMSLHTNISWQIYTFKIGFYHWKHAFPKQIFSTVSEISRMNQIVMKLFHFDCIGRAYYFANMFLIVNIFLPLLHLFWGFELFLPPSVIKALLCSQQSWHLSTDWRADGKRHAFHPKLKTAYCWPKQS